jgi:hypothetical protein
MKSLFAALAILLAVATPSFAHTYIHITVAPPVAALAPSYREGYGYGYNYDRAYTPSPAYGDGYGYRYANDYGYGDGGYGRRCYGFYGSYPCGGW